MQGSIGIPELVLAAVVVAVVVIQVLLASRICSKAGYPPWIGVFAPVPLVSVALAFFLAFAKWPIERELAQSRQGGATSR